MIFKKKLNINGNNVELNISDLKVKKKNIFIFGSPLGLDLDRINRKIFLRRSNI